MIILIGESGSGKTTILNELEKRGYEKAINHTTRAKREGEENLKEYKFLTKEEFEKMWKEGKLLQRAEFNGEYYGISIDSLKDNIACILIVESILDIKNRIKELNLTNIKLQSFYIHVPAEERIKRMLNRGDSLDSIQERLRIDEEKFKRSEDVVDYVIENNNLQEAVNKIIEFSCSK